MQIEVQRYLKRISDVRAWLGENEGDLASVPAYPRLKQELVESQTAIESHSAAYTEKAGASTQKVVLKSALLEAVKQDLDAIIQGAQVINRVVPGFSAQFQRPGSQGEESIIGTARVFAAHLKDPAILAAFLDIGMPADLKDDLLLDIEHFVDYDGQMEAAMQGRMAELQATNDSIAKSSQVIDALDVVVRFRLGHDKLKYASWKQAKRIERARAHRVNRKNATAAPANADASSA